jgi:hypothetical protein
MLETAASVGWTVNDAIVGFHGIGRLASQAMGMRQRGGLAAKCPAVASGESLSDFPRGWVLETRPCPAGILVRLAAAARAAALAAPEEGNGRALAAGGLELRLHSDPDRFRRSRQCWAVATRTNAEQGMLGRRLTFGRLVHSLLRRRPNSDRLALEGPLRCGRGLPYDLLGSASLGIPRAAISVIFRKIRY